MGGGIRGGISLNFSFGKELSEITDGETPSRSVRDPREAFLGRTVKMQINSTFLPVSASYEC